MVWGRGASTRVLALINENVQLLFSPDSTSGRGENALRRPLTIHASARGSEVRSSNKPALLKHTHTTTNQAAAKTCTDALDSSPPSLRSSHPSLLRSTRQRGAVR
mmetsp:Transcript_22905/g.70871  ORF Transcript_22905/g.70871 Transcript_22905/m.70871 type:complete len:105 (-) Transcript_22905:704-1018(-)